MLKKTLLALGLFAATGLSGCIVAAPPVAYVGGPAVVYPIVPVYGYGWYGGYYYGHSYYRGSYYRGGGWGGYHGGGFRR